MLKKSQGIRTWFERWRVFRELRTIDALNRRGHNLIFEEELDHVKYAFDGGGRESGLTAWHRLRVHFEKEAMISERALRLLVDFGAHDAADAMMREGQKRYPREEHFAKGLAFIAYKRGDRQEALRHCEFVRKKFPRVVEGFAIAANCLADLGRYDEAEDVIEQAVRKFPNDVDVGVEYARHAVRRKDWQEGLNRWEAVKAKSDNALGPTGMAHCLKEMGRQAEAEAIARETCDRFPTQPWAFALLAGISDANGDLEEASRRWAVTRLHCPFFALGYTAGVAVARRAGRNSEADEILSVAISRLRADLDIHLEYARNAHLLGDWAAAIERWAMVRARFPDCAEAHEQGVHVTEAMKRQNNTEPDGTRHG
jgi:tetratricopeptide (TPR) repeat protein